MAQKIRLPNNWIPRTDQLPLWTYLENGGKRAVEVAHRRWGKDDVALHFTATQAAQRIGNYWHMLPEYKQARKVIWTAVNPRTNKKRIDDAFPLEIRKKTREDDMAIEFKNGSTWQLVGSDNYNSLVGSPPVGIVFSEWALASPLAWAYLAPILEENNGFALFIYTSRGNNHGKTTYDYARVTPGWFGQLLTAHDTPVFNAEQIENIKQEYIRMYGPEMGEMLYLQEYECFPPTTKVWTSTGQVNIDKININDVVLTHSGRWRKVIKKFEHDYEGQLIEIKSSGSCDPILCTPEHPIRICNPSTQTYKWIPANHIKVGDYVVLPRLKAKGQEIISADLVELIAWFITEGSIQKNAVQFSLNKKEKDFIERIKIIGSKYGTAVSYDNATSTVVQINSVYLADFLTTNCGCGAYNKHIPWHLITGHEEILFKTLINGDGCRGNYAGPTEVFTTISYSLALDVQMLAHILGKRALINKRPSHKQTSIIQGRKVNVCDSYSVRISNSEYRKCGRPKVLPQKHGVAAVVTAISEKEYAGKVYNLSVKYDESYIADGRVVHNCSFEGAVYGSYYAKQMAQARKDKRICSVPHQTGQEVDTFWDLGVDDSMTIWFMQHIGKEYHFIDYYESTGYGLEHYAKVLKEKPYVYGNHYMPHDAEGREMSNGVIAKSRREVAHNLGIKPIMVVERAKNIDLIIQVHIPAVRNILGQCYFDEVKCQPGISALESYKAEYDEEKKVLAPRPKHDWASHAADAFRTFAVGYRGRASSITKPVPRLGASYAYNPKLRGVIR